MELELCKETYSCYEALPPLVETREQSTETIVPDYCPDIARIVEGSGCLFVRSREIADGRVSVSGSLRVTLLYIADGSGGLKSFSYTLPVEETLDGRLRAGGPRAQPAQDHDARRRRADRYALLRRAAHGLRRCDAAGGKRH